VRGITFAELVAENGIERVDLLKVDIEGAEKWLFNESADEWLPKVKTILVEFHEFIEAGSSIRPFQKLLATGFVCAPRGEGFLFTKSCRS